MLYALLRVLRVVRVHLPILLLLAIFTRSFVSTDRIGYASLRCEQGVWGVNGYEIGWARGSLWLGDVGRQIWEAGDASEQEFRANNFPNEGFYFERAPTSLTPGPRLSPLCGFRFARQGTHLLGNDGDLALSGWRIDLPLAPMFLLVTCLAASHRLAQIRKTIAQNESPSSLELLDTPPSS